GERRALVRLSEDGRVGLVTGAPDAGQGVHTIMQQVAAEVLTIPPDRIGIRLGNTDEVPLDPGLGASRHTHIAGQSTSQGCAELAARLKASLAEEMGWPANDVRLEDGQFVNGAERIP